MGFIRTSAVLLAIGSAPWPRGTSVESRSAAPSHLAATIVDRAVLSQPDPDVQALLQAVRGAPPLLCGMAAEAVSSGMGGYAWDAPSPPIGNDVRKQLATLADRDLTASDFDALLAGLDEQDDCVRELSARLLGRARDGAPVDPLLQRLASASTSTDTRAAAALALGLARPRAALDPLLHALSDASAAVRSNAAWALGRVRDKKAVAPLTHALQDDEPAVRGAAAEALGHLRSNDPVAALIQAVQADESADVREMAAWALGQLDDAAAIEALSTALRTDRSSDVKETAAWAIGRIRPEHAPSGLVAGLSSADRDVRLSAAWALGQIRDSTAAPELEKRLQGERDSDVRHAEFRALLMMGDRSESALTTALRSSDAEIREMAAIALAGHGGRPWPWPWPRPRPFP